MELLYSWLDIAAKVMQIITGAAAVFIAFIVYDHNRRRDKESIRERAWQNQQQLNLSVLSDISVLKASEFIIDGSIDHNFNDDDIRRALYTTFIHLNRINLLWSAWKSNILSKKELNNEVYPNLRLIVGNLMLTEYCLTRGYQKDFVDYVIKELPQVTQGIPKPEKVEDFITRLRKAHQPTSSSSDRSSTC